MKYWLHPRLLSTPHVGRQQRIAQVLQPYTSTEPGEWSIWSWHTTVQFEQGPTYYGTVVTFVVSEALLNVRVIGETNAIGRSNRLSGVLLIGDLCSLGWHRFFEVNSSGVPSKLWLVMNCLEKAGIGEPDVYKAASIRTHPNDDGLGLIFRCIAILGSWFSFMSTMCTRGLDGNYQWQIDR